MPVEAVVTVAFGLFQEQGYDETTVETVAGEAGVSARTFYRYFESKDGVLAEGGYEVVDRTLERIGDRRTLDTLVTSMAEVFQELVEGDHFREYAELLRENPKLKDRAPLWRDRWRAYLANELARHDGTPEPTLDHHVRGRAIIGLVALAVGQWLYNGRAPRITAIASDLLTKLRAELGPSRDGPENPSPSPRWAVVGIAEEGWAVHPCHGRGASPWRGSRYGLKHGWRAMRLADRQPAAGIDGYVQSCGAP